jgi:hypothetical protein
MTLRQALCCKMGQEYEVFYKFGKDKEWVEAIVILLV